VSDVEEPVEIPITGDLDLHAFAPRDIADVVEDYVRACHEHGLVHVRLAHGKGTGTARALVRGVLAQMPEVEEFRDADASAGGWGATQVVLKQSVEPQGARPDVS
jgi:DNA-nicking Smr family endonuclease